jgi:ABC-type multidrug transport system ATPase subunit
VLCLNSQTKVLLLDEPTTGVDPVSRKEFWEMLKKLQGEGLTTLVSTPFLDDAELCDEVALIQNGSILDVDTPKNIESKFPYQLWEVKSESNYKTLQILDKFDKKISVFAFGNSLHLSCDVSVTKKEIMQFLQNNNVKINDVKIIKPNIEDVFMDLMK